MGDDERNSELENLGKEIGAGMAEGLEGPPAPKDVVKALETLHRNLLGADDVLDFSLSPYDRPT